MSEPSVGYPRPVSPPSEDDAEWMTPRGMESWVATPRGGFALTPQVRSSLSKS